MRTELTITPAKIARVKELLLKHSIRETGRLAGVSYKTAWLIKNGKYDGGKLLTEVYNKTFDKCPITGWDFR